MENSETVDDLSDYNCTFEMSLNDIYLIALKFFKENKDKAFHLNYANKIKMISLSHHIKNGPINIKSMPEIGVLDVIGKDIRNQCQNLGNISKESAQQEFIEFLKLCCPEFKGFLEAKIKQIELEAHEKYEKMKLGKELLKKEQEKVARDKAFMQALVLENQKRVDEENRLRSVINQQTLAQFHAYAVQQHPDDMKLQEQLIAQLQQHHFHQYMLAIYEMNRTENQTNNSEEVITDPNNMEVDSSFVYEVNNNIPRESEIKENGDLSSHDQSNLYNSNAVEIWCQASINEFKASFSSEPDSVMKIGSGEVVTIRVPGSSNSEYLIWQFATDECDIGFGISVCHDGTNEEVEPVLRRDSHKQVYCGRLKLIKDAKDSEQPFFLLRFDNSYSLWRHKWLYYRVCYSD